MGKRNAEVGPEPPKRPQSGYGQFVAAKRAEITATLLKEGVKPAVMLVSVSKRGGEMWKALGEANQKPYNDKSAKLLVAHAQELEAFKTANPDFKKKGKNGENKPPTRPGGAYAMWMGDNRSMLTETIMKKFSVDKSKAFFLMYKECKPLYDALPAAERKTCEEKAEAAKVKFQAEFKEFKENNKGNENNKGKENNNGGLPPPKRYLGAYPQWMSDNRPMLTEKIMAKHGVDKGKAFLMLYKEARPFYDALPAAEKRKCEEKSEAAKVKFQADHKEWKEKSSKGAKAADGADEDEEGDEDDEEEEGEDEEGEDVPPAKKPKMATTPPAVEADVFNQAKNAGYDRQLKALLEKPEIQTKKLSASKVLKALQDAGGKTIAAKKALLGGS